MQALPDQALPEDFDMQVIEDHAMDEPLDASMDQPDVALELAPLIPEPEDEIAFIYNQDVVHSFELILTEEDLATLDSHPRAEQYVPATLIFDGVTYDNVGVRYKGSAGAWIYCVEGSTPDTPFNFSGKRTCPKLSLKVSFNKYDPEGRFFGREEAAVSCHKQRQIPYARALRVLDVSSNEGGVSSSESRASHDQRASNRPLR